MKKNMGTLDRALRAVAGVVLAGVGAFAGLGAFWTVVAFVLAVLMLGTAAVGYCPAYTPFHWSTLGRGGPGAARPT